MNPNEYENNKLIALSQAIFELIFVTWEMVEPDNRTNTFKL